MADRLRLCGIVLGYSAVAVEVILWLPEVFMNHLGQWRVRILVVLILGGFTVGFCLGQTRGIWTHDYGRTGSFTLWGVHDDLNHIVCYSLVPDGTQAGAAISCVKVEVSK